MNLEKLILTAELVIKSNENLDGLKFIKNGKSANVVKIFNKDRTLINKITFTSNTKLDKLETFFRTKKNNLSLIKLVFNINIIKEEEDFFTYEIESLDSLIKEILL